MLTAVSAAAAVDLCTAFIALEILPFLGPQLGADPSAEAALLDSAIELLLPLVALGALATAVAVIYRHLQHSAAYAGAAGNRRLWGLFAILCASAGTLDLFFFVQPAGIGGDAGAQARALGLAAARVLPAAAAATFFLGMALIIVAHIRAGGFAAADGQIQGPVLFLTKAAYAAAAALALLMAMTLCRDTAMIGAAAAASRRAPTSHFHQRSPCRLPASVLAAGAVPLALNPTCHLPQGRARPPDPRHPRTYLASCLPHRSAMHASLISATRGPVGAPTQTDTERNPEGEMLVAGYS